MADEALARLATLEEQMASLLKIEPHSRFYTENITFFESLTLKLEDRLKHLETNLSNNVVKEIEPRILEALKDCLPDQVQSQIESNPAIATKIASKVATTTLTILQRELAPLQKLISEVKDTSDAAVFKSSSELDAHVSDFQNYCRDSNKNFATKTDLAAALLGPSSTVTPVTAPPKTKMPTPTEFSGKRPDWKTFIGHMDVFFTGSPALYPTDSDKILFTISRLGDNAAFKYMQRYVSDFGKPLEDRPDMIKDYKHFCKVMKKTFGIQNADIVAEAQLTRLTQGSGSTLDYTNKFMELAADIEWNDPAKISAYRKGLNPEVLRMISIREAQEPADLTDYSNLAIDFDQKLYAQNLTSRAAATRTQTTTTRIQSPAGLSQPPIAPTRPAVTPRNPPTSGPTPMDLSNTKVRTLTDEEKAYRRANKLCMYCEKFGHFAAKCPILLAKGQALGNIDINEGIFQDDYLDFSLGKDQA